MVKLFFNPHILDILGGGHRRGRKGAKARPIYTIQACGQAFLKGKSGIFFKKRERVSERVIFVLCLIDTKSKLTA